MDLFDNKVSVLPMSAPFCFAEDIARSKEEVRLVLHARFWHLMLVWRPNICNRWWTDRLRVYRKHVMLVVLS